LKRLLKGTDHPHLPRSNKKWQALRNTPVLVMYSEIK